MEESIYDFWLCNINNIWNAKIKELLDEYKTSENVYKSNDLNVEKYKSVNRADIIQIEESKNIDLIIRKFEKVIKKNSCFVSNTHEAFPEKFKVIQDIPYGIYLRHDFRSEIHHDRHDVSEFIDLRNGNKKNNDDLKKSNDINNKEIKNNHRNNDGTDYENHKFTTILRENDRRIEYLKNIFSEPMVAVVGARNASDYGRRLAYDIGFELGARGIVVVSGMAYGIDSCSQQGAVDAGGKTIAVLGCGVDICYPKSNIELFTQIEKNGIILSEYPLGSEPLSWRFPLRNRLISALADVIIVVEAKEKSGSLITVEYALEQGKEVYAVPGRIGDSMSMGCNKLIKEGAEIYLSVDDILENHVIFSKQIMKTKNKIKNNSLAKDLEMVYNSVNLFPRSFHEIVELSGENPDKVMADLIKLQLMGYVTETNRNYFCRNN